MLPPPPKKKANLKNKKDKYIHNSSKSSAIENKERMKYKVTDNTHKYEKPA
jgi:hypothetical protein